MTPSEFIQAVKNTQQIFKHQVIKLRHNVGGDDVYIEYYETAIKWLLINGVVHCHSHNFMTRKGMYQFIEEHFF